MNIETIRTLSAKDAKRITCSYSCGKQAELSVTYRIMMNDELCFYYYCHKCWKDGELKQILNKQIDLLDVMYDQFTDLANVSEYHKASSISLVGDRLLQAKRDIQALLD